METKRIRTVEPAMLNFRVIPAGTVIELEERIAEAWVSVGLAVDAEGEELTADEEIAAVEPEGEAPEPARKARTRGKG